MQTMSENSTREAITLRGTVIFCAAAAVSVSGVYIIFHCIRARARVCVIVVSLQPDSVPVGPPLLLPFVHRRGRLLLAVDVRDQSVSVVREDYIQIMFFIVRDVPAPLHMMSMFTCVRRRHVTGSVAYIIFFFMFEEYRPQVCGLLT